MLASGLLRAAAVTAPKTTTSDLPQLARLFQRLAVSRNASVAPVAARELSAAIADFRRSYATTTRATKPTTTVKKAVKATAAKKATPKKKTTAKKAALKKKKTKAKKKAAPKKRKRVKKVLSVEEQEKQTIRDLKRKALSPPNGRMRNMQAIHIVLRELHAANKGISLADARREADAKVKALSPAELEHYNHLANQENAAKKKEYEDWVKTHTPSEIRTANRARGKLRKLLPNVKSTYYKVKIVDDRQPRTATAYTNFVKERWASGEMKSIQTLEAMRLIASEWKALGEAEKKKYAPA